MIWLQIPIFFSLIKNHISIPYICVYKTTIISLATSALSVLRFRSLNIFSELCESKSSARHILNDHRVKD